MPTGTIFAPIGTSQGPIGTGQPNREVSKIVAVILEKHRNDFMDNLPRRKGERTLCNAKPLDEFQPLDWIPVDFSFKLLSMRRTFDPKHASAIGIEYNFPNNAMTYEMLDQNMIGEVLRNYIRMTK